MAYNRRTLAVSLSAFVTIERTRHHARLRYLHLTASAHHGYAADLCRRQKARRDERAGFVSRPGGLSYLPWHDGPGSKQASTARYDLSDRLDDQADHQYRRHDPVRTGRVQLEHAGQPVYPGL